MKVSKFIKNLKIRTKNLKLDKIHDYNLSRTLRVEVFQLYTQSFIHG